MSARVAARRRRSPGQAELWPRAGKVRPYCYDCRSSMRDPVTHPSTRQHREATRPPEYGKGSGDWMRPRRFDYHRRPAEDGTPAQNRAAARRMAAAELRT